MDDGFRLVSKTKLRVTELSCQCIPLYTPADLWYGPNPKKYSIENSPHVKLLRLYQDIGKRIWDAYFESDYYRMHKYWDSIDNYNRDEDFIRSKVKRLVRVYDSVLKQGFSRNNRISVLLEPIWKTRYRGNNKELQGYEIWHGHHRAAACIVLGIKSIHSYVYEDILKGTKKCPRLDKKIKG